MLATRMLPLAPEMSIRHGRNETGRVSDTVITGRAGHPV
jgi:hypothetical protein